MPIRNRHWQSPGRHHKKLPQSPSSTSYKPGVAFGPGSQAHLLQLDSLPGGTFGSAGVPTRPAGYTGEGSRAASGIPPAASRQLHSLTHLLRELLRQAALLHGEHGRQLRPEHRRPPGTQREGGVRHALLYRHVAADAALHHLCGHERVRFCRYRFCATVFAS
jgi:hypothetical protein